MSHGTVIEVMPMAHRVGGGLISVNRLWVVTPEEDELWLYAEAYEPGLGPGAGEVVSWQRGRIYSHGHSRGLAHFDGPVAPLYERQP